MHPILPYYCAISLFALLGLRMSKPEDRTMVWLSGWGAMTVVLVASVSREISGDTGRYYIAFTRMAGTSFSQMWAETNNNWLFAVVNWILAQFGTHPLWLILPVTLFCIVMMRHSLRQLMGPTSTAIAILLYSAYPFFIFYVSSGIKQAIAMALLFQGYVYLYRRRSRISLIWFIMAPMFHSGAILVFPFVLLHWMLWRPFIGYKRAFSFSIGALLVCMALSYTGYNQSLMSFVEPYASFSRSYDIYFMDATDFNYRAGFRLDFTLFSLVPFAAAAWLKGKERGLTSGVSGWWLNLYTLLACIYQLFAFAPFSDRFAGFAWYLIPAILVIMLVDSNAQRPRQIVVFAFSLLNILVLQFYTGLSLRVDI